MPRTGLFTPFLVRVAQILVRSTRGIRYRHALLASTCTVVFAIAIVFPKGAFLAPLALATPHVLVFISSIRHIPPVRVVCSGDVIGWGVPGPVGDGQV